jgi:type II secretory ATPase GspE/PulE/Tfp pilus assembly ATPase PilB-like protein
MGTLSKAYLAGILERTRLFTAEQIDATVNAALASADTLAEVVAQSGFAREDDFLEALAGAVNLPFKRLGPEEIVGITQEVLDAMPSNAVFKYNVVPVGEEKGALLVASSDPLNPDLASALRVAAGGRRVRLVVSPTKDIQKAANQRYGVGADTIDGMKRTGRFDGEIEEEFTKMDLSNLDNEESIVKFVNQIIREADRQGATDIHFEPMEERLRIRYRVDGVLHEPVVPPQLNKYKAAIISRIKVMASLDIAEKRKPMDGRIGLRRSKGENIDIRVSTMPTVYGESVSLRLLQSGGTFVNIGELGMRDRDVRMIEQIINRPNGIVLVTGPTGSGKTTSLYAFLIEINRDDVRILTVEDPIEYEMAGINQVQYNPGVGRDFPTVLKAFLRQDPDIIMVGEIRDLDTAEIAIQASLTGHLVFSTLHTNDAAGAFTRLLDMQVEPYLLASAVEAVIAQRLVRKLCAACRVPAHAKPEMLRQIGFPIEQLAHKTIYEPGKCDECRSTGFRGRKGIFEILRVTEDIESMVINKRPSHEIKQKAIEHGMTTLREDGWEKVLTGITNVEEVVRATEESEDFRQRMEAEASAQAEARGEDLVEPQTGPLPTTPPRRVRMGMTAVRAAGETGETTG